MQAPILEQLRSRAPAVAVREYDAITAATEARRWGILTVPATVVIDRRGRVAAVNLGLTQQATLERQLGLG